MNIQGDLKRKYAPAGIRTRVGSSGGSQDIHYPTRADKRHMDVSPYEQDVEEYNNYGIARMVLCILLLQRNETDEVFPPLDGGKEHGGFLFNRSSGFC